MSKRTVSEKSARSAGLRRKCRALVLLPVALAGCAVPPPATVASGPPSPGPASAAVVGDWNDVDAAVRTALRRCQIAGESRRGWRTAEGGDETLIEYRLLTVRGDTGILRVRRLDDSTIGLECRIGVLGSADAERCVLEHLRLRLRELHGVEHAPLGP